MSEEEREVRHYYRPRRFRHLYASHAREVYMPDVRRAYPHCHKHTPPERYSDISPLETEVIPALKKGWEGMTAGIHEVGGWGRAAGVRLAAAAGFAWSGAKEGAEATGQVIGDAGRGIRAGIEDAVDLVRPGFTETVTKIRDNVGEGAKTVFRSRTTEFIAQKVSMTGLRWGLREVTRGVLSTSGTVGLIGGGIAGTAIGGAIVGGVGATAVEYIRQVNENLDRRLKALEEAEAPEDHLLSGRSSFLTKIEGLRYKEVYAAEVGRLGKAAFFGAATGAGAGMAVSLLKDHGADIASFTWDRLRPGASEWSAGVRGRFDNSVEGLRSLGSKDAPEALSQGAAFIAGAATGAYEWVGHNVRTGWATTEHNLRNAVGNFRQWANLDKTPETIKEPKPPAGFIPEAEHEALKDRVSGLEQQTKSLNEHIQNLTGENQNLTQQAQELQRQLEAAVQQNQDLNRQIDELTRQLPEKPAEPEGGGLIPEPTLPPAEAQLEKLFGPQLTVTIPEGSNFWDSVQVPPEHLAFGSPEGWVNPENGVTQEDVVRGYLVQYAREHGRDLNLVHAGVYQLKDLIGELDDDEKDTLARVLHTKSVDEYLAMIRN